MNREEIKSKLESIIEKTEPTRNSAWTLWDKTMTVLLGTAAVVGGVATSVFSLGVAAPIGGVATAAGMTLLWSVAVEAKNAYTKDEWISGGKINYVNFIVNGQASQMLGVLDKANDEDLLLYQNTIKAFEDYFLDKFNGSRFLGEEINEIVSKENLLGSWFASNYAIYERSFFNNNFNSSSERALVQTIVETVSDGTFGRVFGVNHTIKYMLQNGYSFSDLNTFVANEIQKKINDLTDVTITINSDSNTLFSLKSETENAELFWKIRQSNLDSGGRIRQAAFSSQTWQDTKSKLDKASTLFPSESYANNPEGLEVLKDDKSLEDIDIGTYNYKYYSELPTNFFQGWKNYFTGDPNTPKELLSQHLGSRYSDFVLKVVQDFKDNGDLDSTITETRDSVYTDEFITKIYEMIAIDKEIARRIDLFNKLSEASLSVDSGEKLSDQDIKDIETASLKAFLETDAQESRKALTDEQIEDRQRFYKQCALLMNMKELSDAFERKIKARQNNDTPDGPIKSKPFGGRFWRAESDNKETLMTDLLSSEDSSYMFEIPPHVMSQLTPKFKLFKVMNDQEGKLKQTEFIFPTYTDLNRSKNFKTSQQFLGAQFDKGDGIGLKSFNIELNGTTPAEARNDVKATMSLFFQSFSDFVKTRVSYNSEEYRFVDLIIQPKPDEDNKSQGVAVTSLRQYEPTFYRIRVDMGYNIPKLGDIQGITDKEHKKLVSALRSMNKSFYLCMVDHSFNINNDGTVEMQFTYRAYLETALKSLRFDALTTPEIAQKRIESETKLLEVASEQKCTKDELKELQLALAGAEEELILDSLNSIMRRLQRRNKIFSVEIDNSDRQFFLNKGYFNDCDLTRGPNDDLNEENSDTGDLSIVLSPNFLDKDAQVNFNRDQNDTIIQYFFFGDLLHTILDSLFNPETKKVAVGLENTKFILGSFDFDPYQTNRNPASINIANIPISVDFFSEWFRENVINQKSTRRSFPILNFVRNLSNYLVNNAILEACVNRNVEKRIMFQTGNISALSSAESNGVMIDPIGRLITLEKPILKTTEERGNGLPLNGDIEGNPNIEDFYHYIVLNANGSALTYAGSGKYSEDIKAGRFHVEIGSNRGIVKNVKFAKTDMQYLREARFFRNGIDGLLQLSSVYTANVEMFGNTLFLPGMELWINPYGFGGVDLGRPQQGANAGSRSLSNILGIGGYHTITGVTTSLTPSSFTTTVNSQHYYSGDGELPDAVSAKTISKKGTDEELIEAGVAEDAAGRDAEYCRTQILEAINFDLENYNQEQTDDIEASE